MKPKQVVATTSPRRHGKTMRAERDLAKATNANPDLVVVRATPDGIKVEKPVKGEIVDE